jgi:hypothetical protein
MIVADRGKKIRNKNDTYKKEYIDEYGMKVNEHIPYYTTTIFVSENFKKEDMDKIYIEEEVDE